ncbi:MAG: gfo/Idh/MocA family oxidoreductase [Phenylobacterium sp.]|uniref:Gfo/Idh/MocA family protein n=1 Tax=Phenylobacterium sp. TaxID=1871053 RepID=UPI0025D9D1B2|nr:Gfo/Idh/MocA family oxidoreductase [Phenylobacterium sp.]MBI1196948.1 gfo/Idh/MocA family oxidoreductase [Phenylobacterium sp.]
MKQSKRHRIAVIGLGMRLGMFLRAAHAEGWDYELAGHVDPSPVGAPLLAEQGIEAGVAYPDVAALLADGPFDLVMIGSPNHLHLEHLRATLDHPGPIFIEKPIVRTEAESFEAARLIRERGDGRVFVGLVARSAPIVRAALERLDAGAIGDIVSIDATEHLPPAHGAYLARNWRRRAEWGGSYMLDKVCHDFDILRRMIGARPTRVASFGGRRIFTPESAKVARDEGPAILRRLSGWNAAPDTSGADMDVTDHQVAIVEYANGVRLSFHSNTCAAVAERRWNLVGTRGVLTIDLVQNTLAITPLEPRGTIEQFRWRGPAGDSHGGADQAMAHDLVAALEGERAFPVSVTASLVAGLTVMAIDRALAEDRIVDCAPLWASLDSAEAGVAA